MNTRFGGAGCLIRWGGRDGFTLLELMVVLGITGLMLAVLVQLFHQLARGVRAQRARLKVVQNLNNASHQLSRTLGNLARDRPDRPGVYHLVGVDGDGRFERRTRKYNHQLPPPHRRSDRIHLHVQLPDEELTEPSRLASERAYVAFWINGKDSPHPKAELKRGWGLLMRTQKHKEKQRIRGHRMPYYTRRNDPTPLLDLVREDTLLRGVQVVAFHIDYLSFRYWHRGLKRWVSCWNTRAVRPFGCVHPGDHADERWPGAIQFALRAAWVGRGEAVQPLWHRSTVELFDR